jgi:hypothetical protein
VWKIIAMGFGKGILAIFFVFALITIGCVSAPAIDSEKAGYLAGIKFLETHPGETASYTTTDTGGDAFVVYFNITMPEEGESDFAEYYVDKYTRDVYASPKYSSKLAIEQSPNLKMLNNRYPHAEGEPLLIKSETPTGRRYVWELRLVANGVEIAIYVFDAVDERLLAEQIEMYQVNIQTAR